MSKTEWSKEWATLEAGTQTRVRLDWTFLRQLWSNFRKRWRVGLRVCANFPTAHWEWGSGVIGTVTTDGTTLTVTDASTPAAVLIDSFPHKRWVSWGGGTFDGVPVIDTAPSSYDLILDADNPDSSLVYHGHISDTTSTAFQLSDDGIAALNRTLASYNGTRYAIIKRDGLWWSDRWPTRPVWHLDSDSVSTSSTKTTLTDTTKSWAVDVWKDKDLMIQVSGRWKRIPITGNTADTLRFASQTVAPSGSYAITKKNAYWVPGGPDFQPWIWYAGLMFSNYSHYATHDILPFSTVAKLTEPISRGEDPGLCSTDPATPVYDIDAYIDVNDECDADDTLLNPYLWTVIRSIQAGIDEISGAFILDYQLTDVNHAVAMTPGALPMLMRKIGGSYFERTITAVSADTVTFTPAIVLPDGATTFSKAQWAELDSRGLYITSGVALTITTTTMPKPAAFGAGDVGKTLGITFGWNRQHPRRVGRVYPRIYFAPEEKFVDGDSVGYQDPPTADAPGSWVTIPASDHQAEYEELGSLIDPHDTVDPDTMEPIPAGTRALFSGEKYRYVGCKRGDPTNELYDGDAISTPGHYKDYGCVLNSADDTQWLQRTKSGTVTAGTAKSLRDESASLWLNSTPRITHPGTASGGSQSTLIDTTKSSDGFWLSMGGERFVGMVLEVELDPVNASGVYTKRLITAMAGTTLTVNEDFPSTTNAKAYRIREAPGVSGTGPGVMSYWIGTTLRVTRKDNGATVDFIVTAHDNDTFFFDSGGYTPKVGDTWEIVFFKCGDVIQWNGTKFIRPPLYTGDLTALSPSRVLTFGRWRKGDYTGRYQLIQLKKALDALHLGNEGVSWSNNGENNFKTVQAYDSDDTGSDPWSDVKGLVSAGDGMSNLGWDGTTATSSGVVPYVYTQVSLAIGVPAKFAQADTAYAYLTTSPFQCAKFNMTSRKVQVWTFCTMDASDTDPGSTVTTFPGPPSGSYDSVREFNDDALLAGSAALEFRKWTRVVETTTTDATIQILVGNASLPFPSWPSGEPTIIDPNGSFDGETLFTSKGAYVYASVAVVEYQALFDATA